MRPNDAEERRAGRPRLLALLVMLAAAVAGVAAGAPASAAPAAQDTARTAAIPPDPCPVEPCDPPVLTLTLDRLRYPVGSAPRYTVHNGAPNTPIYWSSFLNGVSTGEVNSFYGHYTDGNGFFQAVGGVWTEDHIGDWVKQVSINGEIASAGFKVVRSCGYTFVATKVFSPNESYDGCKGTFVMQGDGNLVVYDEFGRARWASNTGGFYGAYAVFQADGNLVVYTSYGYPLWSSRTYAPGGRLVFQDDGNLVIYNMFGWPVWATNTGH